MDIHVADAGEVRLVKEIGFEAAPAISKQGLQFGSGDIQCFWAQLGQHRVLVQLTKRDMVGIAKPPKVDRLAVAVTRLRIIEIQDEAALLR
jgi:hypothetical protein